MNIKSEWRSAENEETDIQRCVLDTFACFPENEVSFFLDQALRENATIPFLERYRKAQVQSLAPVDMREILETYECMEQTRKASLNFINKNRDSLLKSEVDILKGCVIKEELDNVKELVKSRTVKKWSDKESELFEQVIYSVTRGEISSEDGILHRLRGIKVEKATELISIVKSGVVSKIVVDSSALLEKAKQICMMDSHIFFQSELKKPGKKTASTNSATETSKHGKEPTADTYKPYHNFCKPVNRIMSYQVMAINRGESQKFLKVAVVLPERYETMYLSNMNNILRQKYGTVPDKMSKPVLFACLSESFTKYKAKVIRYIRSTLKAKAVKDSLETLRKNLRQTLSTSPVKSGVIMGIDPGFKNGCKIAIIDDANRILYTGKMILAMSRNPTELKSVLTQYAVQFIALGNGTGCGNVEDLISDLMLDDIASPITRYLKMTTINEAGVSIWSVSSSAEKEFPNLEAGLRSAISLARRLRDPMSELSRVPPQHLSVGQYQLDLPASKVTVAMNDTLQEFVSFAGVDLNTAAAHVLQHVAGLGAALAEKIIKCRSDLPEGRFVSREHLRQAVKGLGAKTFEQCAGFVKVFPAHQQTYATQEDNRKPGEKFSHVETADFIKAEIGASDGKKRKVANSKTNNKRLKQNLNQFSHNPFDVTNIHPSMYDIAEQFLKALQLNQISAEDILNGRVSGVIAENRLKISRLRDEFALKSSQELNDFDFVVKCLSTSENEQKNQASSEKRQIVFVDKTKLLNRRGSNNSNRQQVQLGSKYSGKVVNVADFGAFIELYACCDVNQSKVKGLAPVSVNGDSVIQCLENGQNVQVIVTKTDPKKGHYTLKILN